MYSIHIGPVYLLEDHLLAKVAVVYIERNQGLSRYTFANLLRRELSNKNLTYYFL